jgi:hypothetical protein
MKRRIARELALAVAVHLGGLALLQLLLAIGAAVGLSPGELSRDVATTARVHALTGLQSNLGVLLWWSGASVALFAGLLRWPAGDDCGRMLLWFGALTAMLAADDLLLFHEAIAPAYLGLGEKAVLLGYGVVAAAILLRFRRTILAGPALPTLVMAFALLASSVLVDAVQDRWQSPWRVLVEDGFKLLGIVGWSAYLVRTAFAALRAGEAVAAPSSIDATVPVAAPASAGLDRTA